MFRVEACYLDFVEKCTTLVEMQHLIKKSTLVRYEKKINSVVNYS